MAYSKSIAGACLLLMLAGCGGKSIVPADPLECFPAEARKWIFVENKEEAAKPPSAGGKATVYVDRSGSMVGYLAGATASKRPLHDLIGNLPVMLSRQGATTRYKAFGTRLTEELDTEAKRALTRPDYYSCPRGSRDCDNAESRLNLVFEDIVKNPAEMGLVVTDLWFSNKDIETSALSALAMPLSTILKNGRAIAVYGISAPFDGKIYDLPDSDETIPFEGEHPLFVIAVGSEAQLAALHENWRGGPSPYLAGELEAGRIKRSLFTLNPAKAPVASPAPLAGGTDERVVQTPVIETIENVRVQQFLIGRSAGLRTARSGSTLPSWSGPSPSAFTPDSVWEGEYAARTRVWDRRGKACAPSDWIQATDLPLATAEKGGYGFRLDPETIASEIPREGTYLVLGELVRTGLKRPNPASNWLREWGFGATGGNAQRLTSEGRPFFATLHLGEVARHMEGALADAAAVNKEPILGFAAVIRLEN